MPSVITDKTYRPYFVDSTHDFNVLTFFIKIINLHIYIKYFRRESEILNKDIMMLHDECTNKKDQ